MMDLYIKLSICVPRLIPGRGFYAQISSEITSEFPGVTFAVVDEPSSHLLTLQCLVFLFTFSVKSSRSHGKA